MACKYSGWTRGQDEALINILGGQEVAERIIAHQVKVTIQEIEETLLEFVGIVTVGATKTTFVAKNKFIRDTSPEAKVKISYLSDNFTTWFGDKGEAPIGEQTLRCAKLRKASVDGPIIEELGSEAKAETTLTEIYDLMAKQANGEAGALLNSGWWNVFYVRDISGVLRAVRVYWHVVGWDVYAYSVEYPSSWSAGAQVFSRNSCLTLKPSELSVPAQA